MQYYELLSNGAYLNSFTSYVEAREETERLRTLHPNWNIEVIPVNK